MRHTVRGVRLAMVGVVLLVLLAGAAVWRDAVEHWIGQELGLLAADHLNPAFAFEDLKYTFPRTITLRGVRLTSPDPSPPTEAIDILTVDVLQLTLFEIPRPNSPFRIQQLDLRRPMLRMVRIRSGEASGRLLGFHDWLKRPVSHGDPAEELGAKFQIRAASIEGGRVQYDTRDGKAAIMLIDGITSNLQLHPDAVGTYQIEFALDDYATLSLALKGTLRVAERRIEISTLSAMLPLGREQDHYFTPAMQKLVAKLDITGHLALEATGELDLDDLASSRLKATLQLDDASYATGDYKLVLDRVRSRI